MSLNCPNCGCELDDWVTEEELPLVKLNCKLYKELFSDTPASNR